MRSHRTSLQFPLEAENLSARAEAIAERAYGPEDTSDVNATFWRDRAAFLGSTTTTAKLSLCGTCEHFSRDPKAKSWAATQPSDDYDARSSGPYSLCLLLGFRASRQRTCEAYSPISGVR